MIIRAVAAAVLAATFMQGAGGDERVPRRFGVIVGALPDPARVVPVLQELHTSWVRVNDHLTGRASDVTPYMRAGIDVVITFNNSDPGNVDTSYGSPAQFPAAGFPYRSRERYQRRVRDALAPVLPFLARGRQVWAQCENEITDASVNPRSRYWRGTLDQYVVQLTAFAEAVRSVDPSIPIVLTSVASRTLDALIQPANPMNTEATRFITRLLNAGSYDAADLHFYGCVDDIAPKIAWVQSRLGAGKRWISTENGGPDVRCRATSRAYEAGPSQFEQEQARQVPVRLAACADHGGAICLWFSLFDLRGEEEAFTHLGLIEVSGTSRAGRRGRGREAAGVRRKPAFGTFRVFVERRSGAAR